MSEMDALLSAMPLAITPRYMTEAVNAPVDLYSGSLTLRPDEGGSPGEGRIFLRWLPQPRAAFEVSDVGLVPRLSDDGDDQLSVEDLGSSCRVAILSASYLGGRFSGVLRDDPRLPGKQVERVTFHLPNFHAYMGDAIRHEGGGVSAGRLVLRNRSWRITLDRVMEAYALQERLEAEGGFAITNVGRIERADGQPYSKRKAADLLNALYYFFSFCRGIRCGPVLAVGELIQAALELLSWLVAVEDPKTSKFTEKQFDNNREFPADVRIRHLLAILSIPSAVPGGDLRKLAAELRQLGNSDGVGAVVALRNAVLHPRRTRRKALARSGVPARVEALTLGLWFLEIALLRLFGYRGDYCSRLKSGECRAAMP
jgi:hypothetical protein